MFLVDKIWTITGNFNWLAGIIFLFSLILPVPNRSDTDVPGGALDKAYAEETASGRSKWRKTSLERYPRIICKIKMNPILGVENHSFMNVKWQKCISKNL